MEFGCRCGEWDMDSGLHVEYRCIARAEVLERPV